MKPLKIMNNKGMTLIELITVMTITGIILVPILNMFYNSQKEYVYGKNVITTQSQMSMAMKVIIESLREVESEEVAKNVINNADNSVAVRNVPSIQFIEEKDGTGNLVRTKVVARTNYPAGKEKQVGYEYIAADKVLKMYQDNINNTGGYDSNGKLINLNFEFTVGTGTEVLKNVEGFSIVKNINDTYTLTITARPKKVMGKVFNPITLTNSFIPRYISNNK